MHPLINDLTSMKETELENKINELTRKYFQTYNFELQKQISMAIDTYREELSKRRQAEYEKMMQTRNKDLDKLIKVD
jgi:lipopolysaccharide biosynthesis regulator YciM